MAHHQSSFITSKLKADAYCDAFIRWLSSIGQHHTVPSKKKRPHGKELIELRHETDRAMVPGR